MKSNRKYLLKKYGLTVRSYNKLLKEQGGVCKICKKPPAKRSLAVDHDHKTGKVRGLLCYRCNYGLSWYNNNPIKLRAAAEYLEQAEQAEPSS